jgi:hypothetical protein
MLLHLNFCIEWFDSNSKEDSKFHLKMLWNLEKEKENVFLFLPWHLARRPNQQPTARPPFLTARGCFLLLHVPLGLSPSSAAGPARASARRLPPSVVTDTSSPCVRRAPFLKSTPSLLSKSPTLYLTPNLDFPCFWAPSGYISRMLSPTAPISSLLQSLWCSRARLPQAAALAAASPSHAAQ